MLCVTKKSFEWRCNSSGCEKESMEILLFIERNVLMTDTKKVTQDEQFYAESSSDGKKYNSRGKEPYKHQHGMK